MLHCPVTEQFCPALCTVKCDLVSELVTRTNPNFFVCFRINKFSNFEAVMIIQVFLLLIQDFATNLSFCRTFCKISTVYLSAKNDGKLTVVQRSTVLLNAMQIFRSSKCLFCALVLFKRTNWVSSTAASIKNSQLLKNVFICQFNV